MKNKTVNKSIVTGLVAPSPRQYVLRSNKLTDKWRKDLPYETARAVKGVKNVVSNNKCL